MMKTESECRSILNMLVKTTSWNPHALFLVFVDWLDRDWKQFVTFIFELFWKYFVVNITIVIPPNSTAANAKVSYFVQYQLII